MIFMQYYKNSFYISFQHRLYNKRAHTGIKRPHNREYSKKGHLLNNRLAYIFDKIYSNIEVIVNINTRRYIKQSFSIPKTVFMDDGNSLHHATNKHHM